MSAGRDVSGNGRGPARGDLARLPPPGPGSQPGWWAASASLS
jgi:hypothetical protein